jgi:MFS family permease
VLAATIIGSSLAFIDGTVVSVALPAIAREFSATGSEVQWVVEAYALLLSALLLVGGSMGDRFGRRRIYAWGISLFTVASIACGLAPVGFVAHRGTRGARVSAAPSSFPERSRSSRRPSARRSADEPLARGRVSAGSPPQSDRWWAAGWSITPGGGRSSSTCRWQRSCSSF